MARRPFSGECSVLTGRDLPTRGEKVFTSELARFLGVDPSVLVAMARKRRLLKRTYRHPGREKVYYLTLYGAAQVITAIRAIQGQEWLEGRDYWEVRKEWARAKAAERARAALNENMTIRSVPFSIAIPLAGTEDESREASREPVSTAGRGAKQDES
jgi:Mn-dependent DtxR family transcriptional regulator